VNVKQGDRLKFRYQQINLSRSTKHSRKDILKKINGCYILIKLSSSCT